MSLWKFIVDCISFFFLRKNKFSFRSGRQEYLYFQEIPWAWTRTLVLHLGNLTVVEGGGAVMTVIAEKMSMGLTHFFVKNLPIFLKGLKV